MSKRKPDPIIVSAMRDAIAELGSWGRAGFSSRADGLGYWWIWDHAYSKPLACYGSYEEMRLAYTTALDAAQAEAGFYS